MYRADRPPSEASQPEATFCGTAEFVANVDGLEELVEKTYPEVVSSKWGSYLLH